MSSSSVVATGSGEIETVPLTINGELHEKCKAIFIRFVFGRNTASGARCGTEHSGDSKLRKRTHDRSFYEIERRHA
jgi:hypothetical protein